MSDNSPQHRIVFLTALPVEYQAIRAHLTDLEEKQMSDLIYEQGKFSSIDGPWDVFIIETGQGNHAAVLETERAVKNLQPNFVFFVGVAGGLKDAQIGDVVVASFVYPYDSGKAGRESQARPHALASTSHLINIARNRANKDTWLQRIQGNPPASTPRVLIAPIASGGKVVVSRQSEIYRILKANFEDAQAIEMEGYGFLHTMKDYPAVGAIVIRGVSDRLENKRRTDRQGYQTMAARHASAFAVEIVVGLAYSSGNSPEPSLQGNEETTSALQNDAQRFFEYLQIHRQSLDEAFRPFLEREDIYPDECSLAIKALESLAEHLQSRDNIFFPYPEVYYSLDNFQTSVNTLKSDLQNFRSLCFSLHRTIRQRRAYRAEHRTVRQECTNLLQKLNDLQRQWEQRNLA